MTQEEIKSGNKFTWEDRHGKDRIEILAVAKNYVMWRYKGCMANCHTVKDFHRAFEKAILISPLSGNTKEK